VHVVNDALNKTHISALLIAYGKDNNSTYYSLEIRKVMLFTLWKILFFPEKKERVM
jgi:hypothetical protein